MSLRSKRRLVAALEAKLRKLDGRHADLVARVDDAVFVVVDLGRELQEVSQQAEVTAGELGREGIGYHYRFAAIGRRISGGLAHVWPTHFAFEDGGGIVAARERKRAS